MAVPFPQRTEMETVEAKKVHQNKSSSFRVRIILKVYNYFLAKINRGNTIQNMAQVNILVNGYDMRLSNAVPKVFKHELKFIVTNMKDIEKEMSRGPKNE